MRFRLLLVLAACTISVCVHQTARAAGSVDSYEKAMAQAMIFLDAGNLPEAYYSASLGAALDSSRWEAYSILASILYAYGNFNAANLFINGAIERAPELKQGVLRKVREAMQNRAFLVEDEP